MHSRLRLQLENGGNDCCVNANTLAMLWGAFHCAGSCWNDLGEGMPAVQQPLTCNPYYIVIRDLSEWQTFWQSWGKHTAQRDALEFLATFVPWCGLKLMDCTWERRLVVADQVQTCDRGSKWLPPTFPLSLEKKEISVQELIDQWHSYQGMETRFMCPQPLLAMHLDRDDAGGIHKSDAKLFIPDEIYIPFWRDEQGWCGMTITYRVVSAVVHTGTDRAGHLQAVLDAGSNWYLTDDATVPQLSDQPFADRAQDVVVLWLVRDDYYADEEPAPPLWGRDDRALAVVKALNGKDLETLSGNSDVQKILNAYCVACGKTIFSYETGREHIRHHHPELWPEVIEKCASWQDILKGHYTPCCFCGMIKSETMGSTCISNHKCLAMLLAAVADLYHRDTLAPMSSRFALLPASMAAPLAPAAADPYMDLLTALAAPSMS